MLCEVYKYRVDKPSRSRACFSFALTGISFREHPFIYEISGVPRKVSLRAGFSSY